MYGAGIDVASPTIPTNGDLGDQCERLPLVVDAEVDEHLGAEVLDDTDDRRDLAADHHRLWPEAEHDPLTRDAIEGGVRPAESLDAPTADGDGAP